MGPFGPLVAFLTFVSSTRLPGRLEASRTKYTYDSKHTYPFPVLSFVNSIVRGQSELTALGRCSSSAPEVPNLVGAARLFANCFAVLAYF
jgi:hypothetical protein